MKNLKRRAPAESVRPNPTIRIMNKAAGMALSFTLLAAACVMTTDRPAQAEETGVIGASTEDAAKDADLLKALGASDDQLTRLGERKAVAAYAARTRRLDKEGMRKFLQTYLYAFPESGSRNGTIIDGLVEFRDGTFDHVTPPHGPYYGKQIGYEMNGTIVKSGREPVHGDIPLIDADKVLSAFGYELKTDPNAGILHGSGPGGSFSMALGDTTMTLNGKEITLRQASALEPDGTALIPMQTFTELGFRAEWDAYTRDFHIVSLPIPDQDSGKPQYNVNAPVVDVYVNRDLNLTVNGEHQFLKSMPLNYEGTNYLPVDALAAVLDLDITLNDSDEPVVYFWKKRDPLPWKPNRPAANASPFPEQPAYPGKAKAVNAVSALSMPGIRDSWSPGKGEPLEGHALRYNGLLYLPVTEVAEKAGYITAYDPETKTSWLVKPIEQFVKEKLRLGVERTDIRSMLGNPDRVLLNGRAGNAVWRYDGLADSSYVPAEEKVNDVSFDKPDLPGLKEGKLNYQLFIQCAKPDRIMVSYTLYYRDENGRALRYDVNEFGGWTLEPVQ